MSSAHARAARSLSLSSLSTSLWSRQSVSGHMSSRPCDARAGIHRKHTCVKRKHVHAAGKKNVVGARKAHSSDMTPHSPERSARDVKLLGDATGTPEKRHIVAGCLACAGRHRKHTCAKQLWARRGSVASTSSDGSVAREMSTPGSPVDEQPDEVEDYPEVQDVVRVAVSGPHASSCAACAGSSWRHTCFDGVPRSSSKWRGTRMARLTGPPARTVSSENSHLEAPIASVKAVEQVSPRSADLQMDEL